MTRDPVAGRLPARRCPEPRNPGRRGGDLPVRGAAEGHFSGRAQFEEQAGSGAAAAQDDAGPAHHRPEPGLDPDAADCGARNREERGAGHPQGVVVDFQWGASARRPADPVGLPGGIRKAGAEGLQGRPGARNACRITDAHAPGEVGIVVEGGTVVGHAALECGSHRLPNSTPAPPGRPGLQARSRSAAPRPDRRRRPGPAAS